MHWVSLNAFSESTRNATRSIHYSCNVDFQKTCQKQSGLKKVLPSVLLAQIVLKSLAERAVLFILVYH